LVARVLLPRWQDLGFSILNASTIVRKKIKLNASLFKTFQTPCITMSFTHFEQICMVVKVVKVVALKINKKIISG
jgi:hypothetical protein